MNAANAHELTWVAASPLWPGLVQDRVKLRRPALLRFTTDAFIEDLLAELASAPSKLAERVAVPDSGASSLKLFQPIHGHFYLIAASLVCQLPGLPDHAVDVGRDEKAQLVLRRLDGEIEHAWIPSTTASGTGAWTPMADAEALAKGEELLPLFPGAFVVEGKRRRMLFGLVPTASRETFLAAEVTDPAKVGDDGETVLKSASSSGVRVPKLGVRAGALYVIRCVYRKPRCEPKEQALLSDPSERFVLAAYFDPDAPAREIRIAMPSSLDALKKMKPNVGFVVSDKLRGTLGTALKELKADTDDPAGGGMWIFSIPILTTVAMMLLMMIVGLLNIVLFWSSLIKIYIPINLKAKE